MGMTMTQKILAQHAGLPEVRAGQLIQARLDLVLGNDITSPVAINEFEAGGFTKVFDKSRIAMMYIASVFSQLERETTAERIRDNLRELAKTGRWLGGITPTGYASEEVRQITVDGRVRKACRLREIPEEIALIRSVFETFLETGSLTGTDALLLRSGLVTKNGKRFTRFAIRGILTNPVYMVVRSCRFSSIRVIGEDPPLFQNRRLRRTEWRSCRIYRGYCP